MGVSPAGIESCIAVFEEHGGYCDCEVLINAEERITGNDPSAET
jgi:hypothetical protein